MTRRQRGYFIWIIKRIEQKALDGGYQARSAVRALAAMVLIKEGKI